MQIAWRSFCQMLASLLLAVTIATPAIAEIACADDALTHVASSVTMEEGAGAALPGGGDEPGSPDQAGHCAFNHGHCSAIPAVPASSAAGLVSQVTFAELLPYRPALAAPKGPDRPPQS